METEMGYLLDVYGMQEDAQALKSHYANPCLANESTPPLHSVIVYLSLVNNAHLIDGRGHL